MLDTIRKILNSIILVIIVTLPSCTTTSINGFCEAYKPIYDYVNTELPEAEKDKIRLNNYIYDIECLGWDYKDIEKVDN